jgi:putative ABC transport system substrate-binding protein
MNQTLSIGTGRLASKNKLVIETEKNTMKHKPQLKFVVLFVITGLLLNGCGGAPKPQTRTIGIVIESPVVAPTLEAFKANMAELGYVEGKDVTYIYNGPLGSDAKVIDGEIKNLLAQKVDLLLVVGLVPAQRAKQAVMGTDIPVVFAPAHAVVENGLVESMSHPGGNLTGIQAGNEIPKALEWLVKITPNAKKIYVPYNPADGVSVGFLPIVEKIASQLKVELVPDEVSSTEEAVAAIESLPADIDAIFRIPSPTLDPRNAELSQAAIRRGLPISGFVTLDEETLLTLTIDSVEMGKQAARLTHQILQGIKPADLPVEMAEVFLTINLKTAQAIGLDIADDILLGADKVIR